MTDTPQKTLNCFTDAEGQTWPFPDVTVTVERVFEVDVTLMKAFQRWTHPTRGDSHQYTKVDMPWIIEGRVLCESPVLVKYITELMHAKAMGMFRDGLRPRRPYTARVPAGNIMGFGSHGL